jgi:hypothetical protein
MTDFPRKPRCNCTSATGCKFREEDGSEALCRQLQGQPLQWPKTARVRQAASRKKRRNQDEGGQATL